MSRLRGVLADRLSPYLRQLYGDAAGLCLNRIAASIAAYRNSIGVQRPWDERDVVLIAYGDQLHEPGAPPLDVLHAFLLEHRLESVFSGVHLLPFFPYSSDDGFSVIDFRRVDPALGDWDAIERLGGDFELMFDLVLNHASRQGDWFHGFLQNRTPYDRFFIEVDPGTDLSRVVRPRSTPLLTPVETLHGRRHVWTTFSDDQVDLDFANPDVLAEMIDILLGYLAHGARIIRLDAIAYLWKEIGSPSIHLPQTHLVVKLLRAVMELVAPGSILLTETNVPHEENVSYFGDGDEAQLVYQFSLAPLLLDAILCGEVDALRRWCDGLGDTPPGTSYFNFTASHDGIGVRPLEGLVPAERLSRLVEAVARRGGHISTRRREDGSDSPYELNTTYFSALSDPEHDSTPWHVRRFLASQAVMVAMRGIPAVYFHSLVGTENDTAGFERTGRARSINRRKFERNELARRLGQAGSAAAMVFEGYRSMLAVRVAQPAFHPEGAQHVLPLADPSVFGFVRTSIDQRQRIAVLANLGPIRRGIATKELGGLRPGRDLLATPASAVVDGAVVLEPYQVAWLEEAAL